MQKTSYRFGAILLFAAALASLVLAVYAYVTPLTGVNGTAGALLMIVASLLLSIVALGLPAISRRGWRNVLRVLIVVGLIGTCFAGLLLHRWWIGVAMGIGLIGIVIDMTRPARMAAQLKTKG